MRSLLGNEDDGRRVAGLVWRGGRVAAQPQDAGRQLGDRLGAECHLASRGEMERGLRVGIGQPWATALRVERQFVPFDLPIRHAHRGGASDGAKHRRQEVLFRGVGSDRLLDPFELMPTPRGSDPLFDVCEEGTVVIGLGGDEWAVQRVGGRHGHGASLERVGVEEIGRAVLRGEILFRDPVSPNNFQNQSLIQ